jgi:type III pantothenate kinase
VHQISEENQTLISDTYASLGADRIANMAAAYKLYAQKDPVIVLDFGSATTLSAVSSEGKFLGGLITLGLTNTFHTLHQNTEQLPDLAINIDAQKITPLAVDTPTAIASGCILAHVGLMEHWIKAAKEQLGPDTIVVATGGSATTLAPLTKTLDHVDPDLTVYGINFIAEAAEDQAGQG